VTERGLFPAHQVQVVKAEFAALAEAIGHHHPVGEVIETGGQKAVGTGGVDTAPLCVVFVARPGLVVIVPAGQPMGGVVLVIKVIGVGGVGFHQSALFVLAVLSQQRLLATIDALYLVKVLALPHQQQGDAVAVAQLAQVTFGVAHQLNTVVVAIVNGRQQPALALYHAKVAPGLLVTVPQAEAVAPAVQGKFRVMRAVHRLYVLMEGEIDVVALCQRDDHVGVEAVVRHRRHLAPAVVPAAAQQPGVRRGGAVGALEHQRQRLTQFDIGTGFNHLAAGKVHRVFFESFSGFFESGHAFIGFKRPGGTPHFPRDFGDKQRPGLRAL